MNGWQHNEGGRCALLRRRFGAGGGTLRACRLLASGEAGRVSFRWRVDRLSPSRARRARRSAARRWLPLAPTRRDGRTGVPTSSPPAGTSARVSLRPCVSAPSVCRRVALIAGEGGPSIGPTELAPASPLRVSRTEPSPAGRRVAFRAAGARSVEGIGPGDEGAGRDPTAPRGRTLTEGPRRPSVQDGLRRTTRRRNETRPASPLATRRHARSVNQHRSAAPREAQRR
jgi:hypothetical protein